MSNINTRGKHLRLVFQIRDSKANRRAAQFVMKRLAADMKDLCEDGYSVLKIESLEMCEFAEAPESPQQIVSAMRASMPRP